MFEEYKISDLITELEAQKEKHGDMTVILACDEEGDKMSYVGNLVQEHKGYEPSVSSRPFKRQDDKLIIFPIRLQPIDWFFPDLKEKRERMDNSSGFLYQNADELAKSLGMNIDDFLDELVDRGYYVCSKCGLIVNIDELGDELEEPCNECKNKK